MAKNKQTKQRQKRQQQNKNSKNQDSQVWSLKGPVFKRQVFIEGNAFYSLAQIIDNTFRTKIWFA